jgi:hypothetical protein
LIDYSTVPAAHTDATSTTTLEPEEDSLIDTGAGSCACRVLVVFVSSGTDRHRRASGERKRLVYS